MENSLSKVNYINHLASKSVDGKNVNSLQNKSNKDLEVVADQFESIFVFQMLKQARQSKLAKEFLVLNHKIRSTTCLI